MTRGRLVVLLVVVVLPAAGCSSSSSSSSSSSAPPAIEYVAVGDSYSSGEGNPPYDAGTDVSSGPERNLCHRSAVAFPRVVRLRELVHLQQVACSRATSANLLSPQFASQPAQLDRVRASAGLVTVMVGANDTAAAEVLASCLLAPIACRLEDQAIDERIQTLPARLADALREARRRAPNARILVLGYPQLLPEPDAIPLGCTALGVLGLSQDRGTIDWFRAKTTSLNAAVHAGADAAGAEYVDVGSAFAGHEVCTAVPWVFGLVPQPLVASFHPNPAGHQALADRVAAVIDGGTG